jgi:hypothetical protein
VAANGGKRGIVLDPAQHVGYTGGPSAGPLPGQAPAGVLAREGKAAVGEPEQVLVLAVAEGGISRLGDGLSTSIGQKLQPKDTPLLRMSIIYLQDAIGRKFFEGACTSGNTTAHLADPPRRILGSA